MGRLISHENGIKTIAHVENGDLTIERQFDDAPIVEELARIRQVTDGKGKEMYYAGSLPPSVVESYCNRRGIKFEAFMHDPMHVRALLNDPDYAHLRIWAGKL